MNRDVEIQQQSHKVQKALHSVWPHSQQPGNITGSEVRAGKKLGFLEKVLGVFKFVKFF